MKLPVNIRPCFVPTNYYHYWHDYGRCIACKQEIRHEMHLYNHYKKYHWDFRIVVRYFVWYKEFQKWIEVDSYAYSQMHHPNYKGLRPTAIARGSNVI